MGKIQNFFTNLKRLTSFPQQSGYSGGGMVTNLSDYLATPGSRINFGREVGDLANVALCQSAIGWVARNLYDARLKTVELDKDRKETELIPDDIASLFYQPNPFYSGHALAAGIALGWITRAEAYLIKVRGGFGTPVQLWWEPNETIRPRWTGTTDLVSYYEIERDGIWKRIEVEDVIPIRNGVNPSTRRALINPTASLITEFYTEQRAAYFMNLLLRSGLVPPLVITLGDKDRPMSDPAAFNIAKAQIQRKTSGDDAATPLVTTDNVTATKLGYDYSSVGLKEVRQIPVSRFCMAMGISAISLNADAGDSTHANYNNVQGYLKQDYRSYIVPLHNLIASALNTHLLPDFGKAENVKCTWDYSATALMQPDKIIETKNSTMIWVSGGIELNEYREAVGYQQKPEFDGLNYFDVSGKKQAMEKANQPTSLDDPNLPPTKAKADIVPGKVLDESADYWREHPELDKQARGLMDAEPYVNGKVS